MEKEFVQTEMWHAECGTSRSKIGKKILNSDVMTLNHVLEGKRENEPCSLILPKSTKKPYVRTQNINNKNIWSNE